MSRWNINPNTHRDDSNFVRRSDRVSFQMWRPIDRDWTHRDEDELEPTQREIDLMPLRCCAWNGFTMAFNGRLSP